MTLPNSPSTYDVAIVGAGVVGCALAREFARFEISTVVLERQGDVCEGTSKANTAILHTGFDCVPGTLEARLVREGYALLGQYAECAGIAVERTGAILAAWDDEQLAALPAIKEKAEKNGYLATRLMSVEEVRAREPHLGEGLLGGLEVPGESIICPWTTVLAFAKEAAMAGVAFRFNTELVSVARAHGEYVLSTSGGEVRAKWLINAAGLTSDRVDGLCHHQDFTVTPRRGELIVFDKLSRGLINTIILPVPNSRTKGVLVSPTVFGNVLLGPTADDIDDPLATATTSSGLERLKEAGRKIMPELLEEEVTATYAGLRAATEHQDYQIRMHEGENYVCVGGIRSTGLTSSLAVARYVVQLASQAGLELTARAHEPEIPVMAPIGEFQLRRFLDDAAIAENPDYGEIMCHCERVTRGEIVDACDGEIPATSIGGLRRRTRAMNGRCQGFYCGADVVSLLGELIPADPATLTGLSE